MSRRKNTFCKIENPCHFEELSYRPKPEKSVESNIDIITDISIKLGQVSRVGILVRCFAAIYATSSYRASITSY